MTYPYLWLSEAHTQFIAEQALRGLPHEVCGLIAGAQGRAVDIVPVRNVANDPLNRYVMEPSVLSQKLPQFESSGLEVIGFYHSHPRGDAIPSSADIREAHYPDVVHLIVGLKSGVPTFAAWQIANGRVSSVDLYLGGSPPEVKKDMNLTVSSAPKISLIVAAIVVVCMVIVISLYLLPPAPIIPAR